MSNPIRPDLIDQWHPTKNGELKPEDFSAQSNRKVWWKCPNGHEWEAQICNRSNSSGLCPICTNRKLLTGFNDLATIDPQLASEWHPTKNGSIKPNTILGYAKVKVWWQCKNGHEWEATVDNRHKGKGCPYCSGNKLDKGINDLVTLYPDIAKDWDYEKNAGMGPDEIMPHSGKKVWWKCSECQREAFTSPAERIRRPCKHGQRKNNTNYLIKGNTLKSKYPEIASEWHPSKNDVTPDTIPPKARRSAWWLCKECGFEWIAPVYSRVGNNTKCPFCAGVRIITGINDLQTKRPDLIDEWDYEKNSTKPKDVGVSSRIKAWWVCGTCGTHYQAAIYNRTYENSGCPKCSKEKKVSFPEKAVFYYLKKEFEDACENTAPEESAFGKMNFDIWIPSIMTGVEYDGSLWHQDSSRDIRKDQLAKDHNITVVRIREQGCSKLDSGVSHIIWTVPFRYNQWICLENAILQLFALLNKDIDREIISIERDKSEIYELMNLRAKENSLAVRFPALAIEWHPDKNGVLTPDNVPARSGRTVWWKCTSCGFEWETSPANRTKAYGGTGCPNCANSSAGIKNAIKSIEKNGSLKQWSDNNLLGALLL